MRSRRKGFAGLAVIVLWTALCMAGPARAAEPDLLCGMDGVEDLVALPDSPWIIGSGIGHPTAAGGSYEGGALHLINTEKFEGGKIKLDLSPDLVAEPPYDQCPSPVDPEKFSAHGLSLKSNGDGSFNLYVVNHGGRESVEVFRVTASDAAPSFKWIGCVPSPEKSLPNAVAALPDGGIVLSSSGESLDSYMSKAAAGEKTGAVYRWRRDGGWSKIPNSAFSVNNGIELSDDGKWIYVAAWGGSSVVHMPLDPSLGAPQEIALDFLPDNIRRTPDGQLAVTGQLTTIKDITACFADQTQPCIVGYKSVLMDPETLAVAPLYQNPGSAAFGMATTTVVTDDALWMGTAAGHCVAKIGLPAKK